MHRNVRQPYLEIWRHRAKKKKMLFYKGESDVEGLHFYIRQVEGKVTSRKFLLWNH